MQHKKNMEENQIKNAAQLLMSATSENRDIAEEIIKNFTSEEIKKLLESIFKILSDSLNNHSHLLSFAPSYRLCFFNLGMEVSFYTETEEELDKGTISIYNHTIKLNIYVRNYEISFESVKHIEILKLVLKND